MDVQTIAERARLPARRIRYTVDQRILPGLRVRLQKHRPGQPRTFTVFEGYSVALAALVLVGGVQRQTVTMVMERLMTMPWSAGSPETSTPTAKQRAAAHARSWLEALYYWGCEPTALLIADAANLRVQVGAIDTGWTEPRSMARLNPDYRPRVVVTVDLGPVHAAFSEEDD